MKKPEWFISVPYQIRGIGSVSRKRCQNSSANVGTTSNPDKVVKKVAYEKWKFNCQSQPTWHYFEMCIEAKVWTNNSDANLAYYSWSCLPKIHSRSPVKSGRNVSIQVLQFVEDIQIKEVVWHLCWNHLEKLSKKDNLLDRQEIKKAPEWKMPWDQINETNLPKNKLIWGVYSHGIQTGKTIIKWWLMLVGL